MFETHKKLPRGSQKTPLLVFFSDGVSQTSNIYFSYSLSQLSQKEKSQGSLH